MLGIQVVDKSKPLVGEQKTDRHFMVAVRYLVERNDTCNTKTRPSKDSSSAYLSTALKQ